MLNCASLDGCCVACAQRTSWWLMSGTVAKSLLLFWTGSRTSLRRSLRSGAGALMRTAWTAHSGGFNEVHYEVQYEARADLARVKFTCAFCFVASPCLPGHGGWARHVMSSRGDLGCACAAQAEVKSHNGGYVLWVCYAYLGCVCSAEIMCLCTCLCGSGRGSSATLSSVFYGPPCLSGQCG